MQKFIIFRQVKISYKITGKGRSVFLIHGFGEDATVWQSLSESISDKFQVLSLDLPGTGNSDFAAGITDMDSLAEIVKSILENEHIEKCVLLGHSLGGYISLAFAKKYSHQLNAIGLIHSTAFADSDVLIATRKKSIAFLESHGSARFLQQTIPNLFAPKFVKEHREIVDNQINKSTYINSETLIAYINAMMHRKESITWLSETGLPVLFIIGKEDYAVPFLNSMQQCHLPKISYFHVLETVGHMGMFEASASFNKKITEFLLEDIF